MHEIIQGEINKVWIGLGRVDFNGSKVGVWFN